jgi:hypothetical protein
MPTHGSESEISLRAIVVYLKSPFGGSLPAHKVSEKIGNALSKSQINRIYAVAIERGFDPKGETFTIKDEFIENSPRSGRPLKQTEDKIQSVTAQITTDRSGGERSPADIDGELEVLAIESSGPMV